MTPDLFIKTWRANTRNEAAASKAHFLDLCALLEVPPPHSDPTGTTYAFEKGVKKAAGGGGWADVWKRGCFGWEYKSRGVDLEKAHDQLLRYAGALENPPLLITSDMERIIVRTNWTNAVSERRELGLEDLRDPQVRGMLKACWTDPDRWRPAVTRQGLTEKAAGEFAELARRLRERGHEPQAVAHFVNRLVFCLFADDVDLLPERLLSDMLGFSAKAPANFAAAASELFRAMRDRGGRVGFQPVQWFNGGLFDDDSALPLEGADIALLARVVALDWAEVDPSIFGTLFERGLDPDKRSQLGAHYTDREKIGLLVDAVVVRPLLAEWEAARERIAAALGEREELLSEAKASGAVSAEALALAGPGGITAETRAAKTTLRREADRRRKKLAALLAEAQAQYLGFLDRLRAFRVLDPACGSGNFLYMSLLALKDMELRVSIDAEVFGLDPALPLIGPESVLGIEINPYAAELARVSVWIGHIQWARRNGFPPPSNPVLRSLDTIECRDAVLALDCTQAPWPTSNVIIGNPPFLGGKRMRNVLGDTYCDRLFATYNGRVPAEADFVCYWFARAAALVAAGTTEWVGLVATNSIRGGMNRRVLEPIAQAGAMTAAWSDEAWTLDGAAVRVSLVCWGRGRTLAPVLDGVAVAEIHADLTAGAANLTTARRLTQNAGVAFMGDTKGGAFDVPGDLARQWLQLPSNANGRPNADVLRPWANGMDVTRRPSDTWIIDFGWTMPEPDAAYYAAPYAYVVENVRPVRTKNNREAYARDWWRHVEPRQGMHRAFGNVSRYIVTPRVAKHRLFVWMHAPTLPDSATIAIARDDDTTFGILHSRFHEAWTLGLCTWLGVGNDPRYTPTTTFETFPFPNGLTPNIPAANYASHPHAQPIAAAARALVEARTRWLNPPELVDQVPEVVPGFPDRLAPKNEDAASKLKKRTLTALYNMRGTPEGAWLDHLHRTLDDAVAAAYGWPADIAIDDVLARLLALNHARSAAEAAA
jgi:type II restriction/modification system DNA methylase subunit YeeA